MQLDYKKTSNLIIKWLSKTVHKAGFKRMVIGLSGGIDSSLSATLAVNALGAKNVFVVMLPYGQMSNIHVKDAKEVAGWLEIPEENRVIINIKESVDVIQKTQLVRNFDNQIFRESEISGSPSFPSLLKGNIMARVRMIYLLDLAKRLDALVCGTENKTEHHLGYFTRFGDNATDLEPIQSLYKTQVWEMAKFLDIPERIITKAPTAGLWENQTDEGELGFTYKEADKILFCHFDKKLSEKEIIKRGMGKEVISAVLKRVKQNEFKHNLPYGFPSEKL